MQITLELDSEKALYQQIRDQVIIGVADGRLKEGETLPSIRQLAADFGINFHTVNKAYDLLRQEGLIRLNRKSGAVIQRDPKADGYEMRWREEARVLLADALVKGMTKEEILTQCQLIVSEFIG